MADKKPKSNMVTIECAKCHSNRYRTNKSRKFNQTGNLKLKLNKFCRNCREKIEHAETK